MSTTQSHVQTGPQSTFNFNPSRQGSLTQMNPRADGNRQPGIQLPQMAVGGQGHFMQNRQQQEQHGAPPMARLQNTNNSPMGMLGGQQNGNPAQVAQRQQQHMTQLNQQHQQQLMLQQAQHAQQTMNPAGGGAPGPHMGAVGPNQMSNIGFNVNMMGQQSTNNAQVRRVQSQPQPLNQAGGLMPLGGDGMHHNQQGGSQMVMNPQNGMPNHMRQQRMSNQGQGQGMTQGQGLVQSQMSPDVALAMRQQQGNQGFPQNGQRSNSAQAHVMDRISQAPGVPQPHQPGVQTSHQPHHFPTRQPQTTSPSPRPGTRSQPQTPSNMNMPNPGQPQPSMSRPPQDLFNFQTQFQPGVSSNIGRPNGDQFLVPSSSPPHPQGDNSQPMTGLHNRGLFPTPAQQVQIISEVPGNHFGMPRPPSNIPPRPPSNHNHHPSLPQHQQQPHHPSPQPDFLAGHPPRPQSQPQAIPGRPPSQPVLASTPRTPQAQLPGQSGALGGRIPSLSQLPQPGGSQAIPLHHSASGHQLPIAPRPPQPPLTTVGSSPANTSLPSEGPSQVPGGIPRPAQGTYPLGVGQGLTRLLQFSGILAAENKAVNRLSLAYWDALVKEYFAPHAVMKFTLWKDNQRNEAKPFDIGVPILPRFFLVTAQSGVKSMTLSLDGARERLVSQNHAIIECVTAAWTYKYTNGYTVTLRGPLTAHVIMTTARSQGASAHPTQPFALKFENLDFGANFHDKSISLESIMGHRNPELSPPKTPRTRNAPTPTANGNTAQAEEDKKWEEPRVIIDHASIPGEPVNAFGIPQATMRCLELAESVGQMAELITFADQTGKGPIDGLALYAQKIRDAQANGAAGGTGFHNFPTLNGLTANPAVTLYPPPANAPSNAQPIPPVGTPQNAPPSAHNSPQKQHKSIPPPSAASASGSGPASGTPSMSNATLKRKQTDTASPVTGIDQHPAKRATRGKRRGTGGGG